MMILPTPEEARLVDELIKCKSEKRENEIRERLREIREYMKKYGYDAACVKYA